ncbi:sensor histidine kinase [Enterococcus faecalis]|uniref:sensor histidine kinase n=1 Tax=Enterococcus faecalis TaxID=1351 RepID=UPI003F80A620
MLKNKKVYFILGIVLLVVLYYWFSLYGNVLLGNWAEQTFISTYDNAKTGAEIKEFNWPAFKFFSQVMFLVVMIISLTIIYSVSRFLNKRKERETIEFISNRIQVFMENDYTDENFFPNNYSEIAFHMLKIKNKTREQQEALKKETQQKHDLITYLAHDLKTPLASVVGYLNLLNDAKDLPNEQRNKYTAVALEKAYRLEQLINEFFEISRYNLHSLALNKSKINLTMLLHQVMDEFFPLVEEKSQTIIVAKLKTVMILGDADKLSRVFNNLLKNAIAYGYENSEIFITLEIEEKNIVVAILNECQQLTAYQLEKIFQKFYRVDSSRSTETGGAGLGLAIAKQIIEAHGGEITAESSKERTTFKVKLPFEEIIE